MMNIEVIDKIHLVAYMVNTFARLTAQIMVVFACNTHYMH